MDYVNQLESEIIELRKTLQNKEKELYEIKQKLLPPTQHVENGVHETQGCDARVKMGNQIPKWAIERYSRQILLPQIGVQGQELLMAAKVLVVGAGGLGCPAALYLAGAGVGEIGIVDYDKVDVTNIHRQILHGERDEHMSKVESAANSLRSINSHVKVTPYNMQLDSSNAIEVASHYDFVLDCSDNVPTRYLLNDLCVLTKVPLIAGCALKMEGQITVFAYRPYKPSNEKDLNAGPCYRCVFPDPPSQETVGSCSTDGVAGPVPGVIGTLQALEAIKLIVGRSREDLLVQRMLLFDGEDMVFRTIKLRERNPQCAACSANPTITALLDYEVFCKAQAKEQDLDLHILPAENRISASQLAQKLKQRHLLVDVRSDNEFSMCNIDGAVNYPIKDVKSRFGELLEEIRRQPGVTFVCRRGNDSQIVAKMALDALEGEHHSKVTDVTGGLHAWAKHVDTDFPIY